MTPMDRLIATIPADQLPAALRLLALLEWVGEMDGKEAAEWRRRIRGWADYYELPLSSPVRA